MHWFSLYLLGSAMAALLIDLNVIGILLLMACTVALFMGGAQDAARKR